jgi:hypothetical protein
MIDPVPVLRVVMAQLNLLVGDIPGNTEKIVAAAERPAIAGGPMRSYSRS